MSFEARHVGIKMSSGTKTQKYPQRSPQCHNVRKHTGDFLVKYQ